MLKINEEDSAFLFRNPIYIYILTDANRPEIPLFICLSVKCQICGFRSHRFWASERHIYSCSIFQHLTLKNLHVLKCVVTHDLRFDCFLTFKRYI
jgi:hypothetical protein